jgi:SsrA-binding protein
MSKKEKNKRSKNTLASNKNAYHKYLLQDTYTAGIVLTGAEVKAIKNGKMNLKESFVKVFNDEPHLINAFIAQYSKDSSHDYNPKKDRKLLLNKREISQISSKLTKGTPAIPTKAYLKNGFIKLEIAIGKPKKLFNKKQELKIKDEKKEAERAIKWKQ